MRALLMQGWTTVRGSSGILKVIQGEDQWLDLTPYQDAAFWIDCREITGTPSLTIETAPARDDSLFAALVPAFTLTPSQTPVVKAAMLAQTATPLARFARWKLTVASGVWDATFRIWAAVNVPGM